MFKEKTYNRKTKKHNSSSRLGGCKGTNSRCVLRLFLGANKEQSPYLFSLGILAPWF